MKKIGISFKDTESELYEFLKKQLSPSIYIKELIKEKMQEENKNDRKESKNLQNPFDF